MKYYEFEYKNKLQKILWNLNALLTGAVWMIIGFALMIAFNNLFSTFVGTFLLAVLCVAALIISIYNFVKMKGVFLFEDYIEISSVYTKKTIIPIDQITDINEIEKYGIVGKGDIMFKGGGRTDVVQIHFKNVGIAAFKIKKQDEFLKELHEKISGTIVIE